MTPSEMVSKIFDLVNEGYAAARKGDMSLASALCAEASTIMEQIANSREPVRDYLEAELDVSILQSKLEGKWPW